jgi:hypothetical protein
MRRSVDQGAVLEAPASLPISTMSQWWVSRSRSAVVILASPKTAGHSPKARLVGDDDGGLLIEPADQVEKGRKQPTPLGELLYQSKELHACKWLIRQPRSSGIFEPSRLPRDRLGRGSAHIVPG